MGGSVGTFIEPPTARSVGHAIHDRIHDYPEDFPLEDVDPERLAECSYWRCRDLFEQRSANHRFCRKACRSRQKKWERSVERKAERARRKT